MAKFMIMNSLLSLLFFIIVLQLSSTSCAANINTRSSSDSVCNIFPPPATNTTSVICVDKNGCCNFTNVQAAVDAIENLSQKRTIIWINSSTYIKKVMVTKSNVTFQGQGFQSTFIAWNDTANSTNGTFYSASVHVSASNFIAKNISFQNLAPRPNGSSRAQAVAFRMEGDQAAFWGCGFYGYQDTLHDDKGRHYFRDCFIQGSIDFIFGDARSLYENCQLNSIAQPNGAITAHGRDSSKDDTGFAFVNCSITGTGSIWLGRAWRSYSRVVFAFTSMADIISPDGWNDMGNSSYQQTVFYGEYMCTGPGANMSKRVPYARTLLSQKLLNSLMHLSLTGTNGCNHIDLDSFQGKM